MDFWLREFPYADQLEAIERELPGTNVFRAFRNWPLSVYLALYDTDLRTYPLVSAMLPKMPSTEVQINWTGKAGLPVLDEAARFLCSARFAYEAATRMPFASARMLDYGAGWGRLTRVAMHMAPQENISACDGWQGSVDLFNSLHFPMDCFKVPEKPTEPCGEFDFIWAFSVFTHLNENANKAVQNAIRESLVPGGILALTYRPSAYWALSSAHELIAEHRGRGFVFRPIEGASPNYGDASFSLTWLEANWRGWKIIGRNVNLFDPYQPAVYLQKV